MRRRLAVTITSSALAVPLLWSPVPISVGAVAPPGCPSYADPVFAGETPTPAEVLGFEIGAQEVTSAEINTYLDAVDDARDDVTTGSYATSVQGRDMRYAVVGDPADVSAAQRAARLLRDPATSPARARQVARTAPAIMWMAGNVHGNEESGADGSLRMLYELADRTDCAAQAIRDSMVVVVMPTQNPDGRELDTRRNFYGFDLNRDWFARTQVETDGKVELLRDYPAVLLTDNHEMGADGFFFPPNADPVHHEIADLSIEWINDLYGAAMIAEFERRGLPYFNYDIYDLLYMGYGDTVPTTGLLGAGMTMEKNNEEPIAARADEQFIATWASMFALAENKRDVLTGWARSHRQAYVQGRVGRLEPNAVFAPGSELELEVPDERLRSYFLRDTGPKREEVRALVRRLQRMDVEVRRLTAPLVVPDYRPYGAAARRTRLPAGTFYVSMAQGQKHWIQAMLGEDSYVPFPYFYDVTAWSGPLLYNVGGGGSGAWLTPRSRVVPPVPDPGPPGLPADVPSVGLWLTDDGTSAYESEGWARWLLTEKWQLPHRLVSTADVAGGLAGGLSDIEVLVVPNGDAETAYADLGADGQEALRQWLAAGGRFVGFRGGTELAALLGITTATLADPTSDVPGSLIRARMARGPLRQGVGGQVWSFYEYEPVMSVADPASAAVTYPTDGSFFVSGYERGADELRGTAAVVAERYADGRVVLFAGDPNFRAFTDGTQQILWNAILSDDPAPEAGDAAAQPAATARSVRLAAGLTPLADRAVLTLRSEAAPDAAAAVRASGRRPVVTPLGDGLVRVSWRVPDDGRVALATVLDRLDSTDVVTARAP